MMSLPHNDHLMGIRSAGFGAVAWIVPMLVFWWLVSLTF